MFAGKLEIRELDSFKAALDLRRVRNECRLFMTGSQKPISVWRQWRFWQSYLVSKHEMWAFIGYLDGNAVAYGLIRWDDNKYPWISGGIKEEARGLGLGREVFQLLTENAQPRPARLDVLASNKKAIRLYESLGWRILGYKQSEYGLLIDMIRE